LTAPIGAAVTFLMYSVLHEATHHALSTDTRLNNAFGVGVEHQTAIRTLCESFHEADDAISRLHGGWDRQYPR
jgi:hypothetical protein